MKLKLIILMLGVLFLIGCTQSSIAVSDNLICDPINETDCAGVDESRLETVVRPQVKLIKVLEFSQVLNFTFVNQTGVLNDRNIIVDDGSVFSGGDRIALVDGTRIYGAFVQTVVSQNLTLDTPLDFNYSVGSTAVRLTRNLNIDGSVTPQIFQIGTVANVTLDITRIIFSLTDSTAGDDSTFGGCPALTNGVVLRFMDGATYNIFNIKTNGELSKIAGGDFTYAERAGPGEFGFNARFTFNGQDKLDSVIEIKEGEMLQIIIQDDLTCLNNFNIVAEGNTDIFTLE